MKRLRTLTPVLLTAIAVAVVALAAAALLLLSCGGRDEVKILHPTFHEVVGPGTFELEGVPRPPVSGGYGYDSHGHFWIGADTGPSHKDFYWQDGRFAWADGSLMSADDDSAVGRLGFPDFSDSATEEALGYSAGALLTGLGWWVAHVYIDSRQPLAVTFSAQTAENAPFIEAALLRFALYGRTHGLSMDRLAIELTSKGRKDLTPAGGMAQAAARFWPTAPASPDNEAWQSTIEDRLAGEPKNQAWTVKLLEVTTSFMESRRVNLIVAAPAGRSTRAEAELDAAEVLRLIQSLNADEGAGIAVLRVDAVGDAGSFLLRDRWDLDLGTHASA